MAYMGIDYGLGRTNVNLDTGIRYGVISQHSIIPEAMEDFEYDYGQPTCPKCGNSVSGDSEIDASEWDNYSRYGCNDFICETCEHWLDSDVVYSEEALGMSYESSGYKITDCLDSDLFILDSPFYTFAQFCSPCVPGAGNLNNFCENGPKTYALGPDWFEDERPPYPIYRVSDSTLVV